MKEIAYNIQIAYKLYKLYYNKNSSENITCFNIIKIKQTILIAEKILIAFWLYKLTLIIEITLDYINYTDERNG